MKNSVVKYVVIGFVLYGIFAALVLNFYTDDPDQMNWEARQSYNLKFINTLDLTKNYNREMIIELLGAPDITEARMDGDETLQVMFYRTNHAKSDGITTKDECTPLLFKDGKLIAWGITAFEKYNAF